MHLRVTGVTVDVSARGVTANGVTPIVTPDFPYDTNVTRERQSRDDDDLRCRRRPVLSGGGPGLLDYPCSVALRANDGAYFRRLRGDLFSSTKPRFGGG